MEIDRELKFSMGMKKLELDKNKIAIKILLSKSSPRAVHIWRLKDGERVEGVLKYEFN